MANIDRHVLVVHSVTNAMRGQKLLEQNGFTALVQRNTGSMGKQGCGYAIRMNGDVNAAMRILAGAGIPVTGIQEG